MLPKVLLVCTNADLAGAPRHVQSLVNGLVDEFHYTCVFGEEGPIKSQIEAIGVRCLVIEEMQSNLNVMKDACAFFKLLRIYRAVQPDIIHAHSSKAAMIARLVGWIGRSPTVFTVHGWGWRGFSFPKRTIIQAIEWCLARLGRQTIIAVAESVRTDATDILGIASKKIKVIHNGIAPSKIAPIVPNPPNFMMAARVSEAKDHETIVRAFEAADVSATLTLFGEGTNSSSFKHKVAQWAPQNGHKIKKCGLTADIDGALDEASVFVLSSKFEALPISIIEAMNKGLPVIASNVGGVGELVISGEQGILVPKQDISATKDAILQMMSPQVRLRMGKNARKRFCKVFTLERMLIQTRHAYEESLRTK